MRIRKFLEHSYFDADNIKDLIKDISDEETPFETEISQQDNCVKIVFFVPQKDNSYISSKKYFTYSDYNRYIYPVINRILQDESIYISHQEVQIPLNSRIEYFGNMINRSTGSLLQSVYSTDKSLIHSIKIEFRPQLGQLRIA